MSRPRPRTLRDALSPFGLLLAAVLTSWTMASCTSPASIPEGTASSTPHAQGPDQNDGILPTAAPSGDTRGRLSLPPVDLRPTTFPSWALLDQDAKPGLTWSIPGRFDASWQSYDPHMGQYDPNFINPDKWSVTLDACASRSVRAIKSYTFTLTRDHVLDLNRTTPACKISLDNLLPSQGRYLATLTLHTDWGGGAEGVSPKVQTLVDVRDRLIVAMGDSLAAGEGNPDRLGEYEPHHPTFSPAYDSATEIKPVVWSDPQCHRSNKSGPALAAKSFENSHTSVTFVSVACSGAQIYHLIDTPYEGIDKTSGVQLPPQTDEVARVTGPTAPRGGRQIDALILSAGINDLHFGDIVHHCAKDAARFNGNCVTHSMCWPGGFDPTIGGPRPADTIGRPPHEHRDCYGEGRIGDQMYQLPRLYGELAKTLREKLPNVRETYINDYPANVFEGGACGKLNDLPGVGIGEKEGTSMYNWGTTLSHTIIEASHRYRTESDRWNMDGELTAAFESHHYCSGIVPGQQSWFTMYESSWSTQGDEEGTAHPNAAGHAAYGEVLRRAIVMDQLDHPYRRLHIKIAAEMVEKTARTPVIGPVLMLQEYQNDEQFITRQIVMKRTGNWESIPYEVGTFSLDVWPEPASPRHATQLWIVLNGISAGKGQILAIHHTIDDAYGSGRTQEAASYPNFGAHVRYTVEVEDTTTHGGLVIHP